MDNLAIIFGAPVVGLQLLIDGLLVGAIFALVAYGMALVWGVMNIINVAQGEFVILGAYVTYFCAQLFQISPFLVLPVTGIVLFVFGWLLYQLVIYKVVDRDLFTSLLATFGISILLQQLMNELFGSDLVSFTMDFGSTFLFDEQLVISHVKIFAAIFALIIGVLLFIQLKYSRFGLAIRATSQNVQAAKLLGINTHRIYAATFGINAALCGMAGALVVAIWVVHPFSGLVYTVRSFMIVVVAGLGNLLGVAVSALTLGALENTAGFVLGAEFQTAFIFTLLVVILILRNALLHRKRSYLQ